MVFKQLIQLRGGFPWGFRLSQDHLGIRVQRVRPNSKAAFAGLLEGDVVARINQFDCRFLTLREVNYLIDQCQDILALQIERSNKASHPSVDYPQQRPSAVFNSRRTHDTIEENSPSWWRQSGVVVARPNERSALQISSNSVSLPPRSTEYIPAYIGDSPTEKQRNGYRCTIEFVHRPSVEKTIGSLRSSRAGSVLPTERKPYYPTIQNVYSGRGYASDAESWHRSEFSLKPRLQYAPQKLFQPKEPVTSNLYQSREPVSRQPKFHVVRRATVEPFQESQRRNSATQTTDGSTREISNADIVRRVRIPSEYEGDLTDDQRRDIQRLGSLLKYKSRGTYADSMFCRGPPGSYPTIEEQKRLAKRIAEILENATPPGTRNSFRSKSKEKPSAVLSHTKSAQTDHMVTTEEEDDFPDVLKLGNLPKCIEDSVRRTNQNDVLKSVASPPEFQVLHLQDHTTHTAVPPDVCMNFARQLKYGPGKGAELFQRRKARSEKWVVDSNRVTKMIPRVAFSDTEVRSPTIYSQRKNSLDFYKPARSNYFNTIPRGWMSMTSSSRVDNPGS